MLGEKGLSFVARALGNDKLDENLIEQLAEMSIMQAQDFNLG
jgi:hypothetical protein